MSCVVASERAFRAGMFLQVIVSSCHVLLQVPMYRCRELTFCALERPYFSVLAHKMIGQVIFAREFQRAFATFEDFCSQYVLCMCLHVPFQFIIIPGFILTLTTFELSCL